MNTPIHPSKPDERIWLWFSVLIVTLIVVASFRWMLEHPYAVHADEALYVNEVQIDLHLFHAAGIRAFGHWVLHGDPSRPPAYRLMALPFLVLFGYSSVTARLVTLACFVLSALFIFLTARRFASPSASAIAVLIFCLSPDIIVASITLATEGGLYLAIAATLYFTFAYWSDDAERLGNWNWIGLGLAIGLGCLSKITFVFVAAPVVICAAWIVMRRGKPAPGLFSLVKAGLLGLVIALPWWRFNFREALGYAEYASRGFPRHSIGPHSFITWGRWLGTVFLSLLGPGVSILIALVLIAYFRKAFRRQVLLTPAQRISLIGCACAGLPLIIVQLSGSNYLLRHISPAVIPLAVAVAVLSDATGWMRSKALMATSGLLCFAQFLMLIYPAVLPNRHPVDPGLVTGSIPWRVMVRFEQWNWNPLREISSSCGLETPKISFLGNGRAFNGAQIQYAWVDGRPFNPALARWPSAAQGIPDAAWLWRYEDGPIGWQKVMDSADQSDITITAPNYVGQVTDRQDQDNEHNAEFAARLSQDPHFHPPIHLEMGQLDPVDVEVFVKSSSVCH